MVDILNELSENSGIFYIALGIGTAAYLAYSKRKLLRDSRESLDLIVYDPVREAKRQADTWDGTQWVYVIDMKSKLE
jgi:hypothetical protein